MSHLEPVQEELLKKLVEAELSVPSEKRHSFQIRRPYNSYGAQLRHAGWDREERIFDGDIEVLAQVGLVSIQRNQSSASFYVTPAGYQYCRALSTKGAAPLERVEERVLRYLGYQGFRKRFPVAFSKWTEAEHLLWQGECQRSESLIGHLIREAMQEFVDAAVHKNGVETLVDKTKTVARLRDTLNQRKSALGETALEALKALLAYWGALSDLVQRQEHEANRENERLTWADSRRLVFLSAVLFTEVDLALR
jgi:hypothetical protein